jgi:hypothetical protein
VSTPREPRMAGEIEIVSMFISQGYGGDPVGEPYTSRVVPYRLPFEAPAPAR